jgi:uncharacterized membrane protein YbhN (UPF0104 family)
MMSDPGVGPGMPPSVSRGAEARGSSRGSKIARALFPWLVAASCLVYAFEVVPFDECLEALGRARLGLFLPLVAGAVLVWFTLESAAYAYTFSRFNVPISWRDARSLRALSYLLTVIHWHLAKAAVVLRLNSAHGVGILAATSTLLLYQMIGVGVLALFATVGALMLPKSTGVAPLALATIALLVGVLTSLALLRSDRPRLRPLDALRALTLAQAHRKLEVRDVVIIGGVKVVYQLVFVLVYYFGMRAFGLAPSFSLVLIATPILQAIGSLPITPAGFGTQQAAMLFLFSDPAAAGADGAAVLAFAFSLPITTMALRGLLALCYLTDLSRPGPGLGSGEAGRAESTDARASITTGARSSATTRV